MKKRLLSLALIASLIVSTVGCGDKNDAANDNENSSSVETSDAASAVTSEATDNDSESEDGAYKPTQEIMDAKINSGLIQIGNEIFRNGGYLTVNEFMEEYGDIYEIDDPDRNNIEADFPSDWARSIRMTNKKDPEMKIVVYFDYAPDNSKVLGEGVVVRVNGDSELAYQNTWQPWSFMKESITADLQNGNTISCFDEIGMEFVDYVALMGENKFIEGNNGYNFVKIGDSANEMKELANKYGISSWREEPNTESYLVNLVQDEVNLYGVNPIYRFCVDYNKSENSVSFAFSRLYGSDRVIIV